MMPPILTLRFFLLFLVSFCGFLSRRSRTGLIGTYLSTDRGKVALRIELSFSLIHC